MTTGWQVADARPAQRRAPVARLAASAVVVYVVLWLCEGALRKWVPATGSIMYIGRDVVLLGFVALQYLTAPPRRGTVQSVLFWGFTGLLVLLTASQVVLQGSPALVTVLGLRSYLAPVAFVYFFWRFWRPQGRLIVVLLLAAVPVELALTAAQVVSPASAFVNINVAGESAGLVTADGVVRGTGTFSDAGVLASYCTIVLALCLGLFSDRSSPVRRPWLVAALAADILMIAIGGARTAVFAGAIVLIVWVVRELARAELRSVASVVGILSAGGAVLALAAALYPTAVAAFGERFVTASTQENSVERVINSAVGFVGVLLTPLGSGAGSRSSIGVALGSGQTWIEVELTRWVVELGAVGFVLVLARLLIGVVLGVRLFSPRGMAATTATMIAVLVPELVAGSINVNPAVQAESALIAALTIWSASHDPGSPHDTGSAADGP